MFEGERSFLAPRISFVWTRRRKRLAILVSYFLILLVSMNVAIVAAFSQKTEINGLRLETDKEVYRLDETVHIRFFLVNTLGESISVCFQGWEVRVKNSFGFTVYHVVASAFLRSDCAVVLPPGTEALVSSDDWRILIAVPGPHEITVSVNTNPDLPTTPTGSTRVLVLMVP